jgi:hypothetical protein
MSQNRTVAVEIAAIRVVRRTVAPCRCQGQLECQRKLDADQ